tara:strand:- start:217 stop:423 length:207 start_codon:yes stop_codon:yes gene_type:complete
MEVKGIAFDANKWNVEEARREMKTLGLFKSKINRFAVRKDKKLYYKFVEDFNFKGKQEKILNDYIFFY